MMLMKIWNLIFYFGLLQFKYSGKIFQEGSGSERRKKSAKNVETKVLKYSPIGSKSKPPKIWKGQKVEALFSSALLNARFLLLTIGLLAFIFSALLSFWLSGFRRSVIFQRFYKIIILALGTSLSKRLTNIRGFFDGRKRSNTKCWNVLK